MQRTLAIELPSFIGHKVCVRGWLNSVRALGKISFLLLRDRTGLIQIVIQDAKVLDEIAHLHPGSILTITGTVVNHGKVEVIDPKITVENEILSPPPLEYYKPEIPSELDYILDHRSIALRNRKIQAVFRIQAEIAHAYHSYMYEVVGATEYFSPNLLGSSSEGGAEFFNVDYFGYPATLAQSSQLYKQIMVGVNERVFALMPFFRAEPSQTTRHVSEGKQFEFEMGFFDSWHELMEIQEGCLKFIIHHVENRCRKELEELGNPLVRAPQDVPFPKLTFAEAQELFFERTGVDERKEPDLSPAAERDLCAWALEQYGTDFLFVTDWPTKKRPFYAYPDEKNPEITHTFDLLCAGIEIASGGQRRHTYPSMVQGILDKQMDPKDFVDYLSIFQYGMPPHGGFGMGLERLTMTSLHLKNIREATLFPSDTKRIASTRLKARIFFGGENIRNEILRLCHKQDISIQHMQHPAALSSEESATHRNTPLKVGIKALILKGKKSHKNYQFNIPAHEKLDLKAVYRVVGEKCEFESKELIEERFGLQVGGIPPFGGLLNLETYFDESIRSLEQVAFNCGLPTESIVMATKDLISLVLPNFDRFIL